MSVSIFLVCALRFLGYFAANKTRAKVRSVVGVVTNDVGVSRSGRLKANFEPGMIFRSKVTLLAEGAHGSLSKIALDQYKLRKESEGQTYGFGLKEVWRVAPDGMLQCHALDFSCLNLTLQMLTLPTADTILAKSFTH